MKPPSPSNSPFRRRLSVIIAAFVLLITAVIPAAAENLTVTVLAVGHGDAIFIEFPQGHTMLVDGGTVEAGSIVTGAIRDKGYANIDYVVLTHTHPDHVGGLLTALEEFPVAEIWTSEYCEDTKLYRRFKESAEANAIPLKIIARGDEFHLGGVNLQVLNPPPDESLNVLRGLNGASIVMKLEYGETSILLAADIDNQTDREMAEIYGDSLKSDVLKCAHHGSDCSSSEAFIRTVAPKIAVVSTGPSKYGYPSEVTMKRIRRMVPEVYRTDNDGTVIFVLGGQDITVELE